MGKSTLIILTLSIVSNLALHEIPLKMSSRKAILKHAARVQQQTTEPTPSFAPQIIVHTGTPSQLMNYIIDTTTGDSFIVDFNADPQPNSSPWQYRSRNSTSMKLSSYPYNSDVADLNGYPAHISGVLADELFSPMGFANGKSFRMKFAMINAVTTMIYPPQLVWVPDMFSTGRLGFGFYASENMDTFVTKLLAPQNATQKSFGLLSLECMVNPDEEVITSRFSLGGVDPQFCNLSTSVSIKMADARGWDFKIDAFDVGTLTLPFQQIATINTGEMLTGVPQKVYNYVAQIGNATINPNYIWPIVDCNASYPTLDFSIGGKEYRLSDQLYIFRNFEDEMRPCHLMLYPLNGGGFLPSWSFGYLLIYQKCMLFDYGRRTLSLMDYNQGLCS